MTARLAVSAIPSQAKIAKSAMAIFAVSAKSRTMPDVSDVAWIKEGLKQPGKSQKGLADAMRTDPGVITRLLKGDRQLKASEISVIKRYLSAPASIGELEAVSSDDAYAGVPVYDVRISAGPGSLVEEVDPKHYLMFRRDWLHSLTRAPSQLCVLEVSGDSMWETLHDGDHTLVDRSQINPAREGLYVLRLDDSLVVKRISMHPVRKTLTIKSDNASYPTYTDIVPEDVSIFGRVVWIGRRL
jgi:phage repressor protein C with HTH and peptisase S24 domain